MSGLAILGGLGSGISQGIQNAQAYDINKQRIGLGDLAMQQAQRIAEDQARQHANEAANRAVMASAQPGTESYLSSDAANQIGPDGFPVDSSAATTIQKPVDMSSVYTNMADAAQKRGDIEGQQAAMQMKLMHDKLKQEGVIQAARTFYTGGTPQQIESDFNAAGGARVIPGSTKITTDANGNRMVSGIDVSTGQPISMTQDQAHSILQMGGIIPMKQYVPMGNTGMALNPQTGETIGDYHSGNVIIPAGAMLQRTDDSGNITTVLNPKTFNPNSPAARSAAYAKGGLLKTTDNADGTTEMWFRDGTHSTAVDANNKPLKGAAGKNAAIRLMAIGGNLAVNAVPAGQAVSNAQTLAQGVNNAVNPPAKNPNHGAAAAYLGQAKSQADFTARVKALKQQGWTDNQIREMAQ